MMRQDDRWKVRRGARRCLRAARIAVALQFALLLADAQHSAIACGPPPSALARGSTESAQLPASASVGAWSSVMNWPGVAAHAHLLPTGNVLTWTDYADDGGAQIWDPGTNTFTPVSFGGVNLFCAGHSFLADGRILITGGFVGDDLGPRETTIFDPATNSWAPSGLMMMGRYYPTSTTLPDGRVLVQGGTTTCNWCVADRPEIYDPATGTWAQLATSAIMAFKYYPHTFVLPDGRVIVAGQNDHATLTQALDLTSQTWTTIDSRIIDGHSSVMYLPGKIMKAGTATADDPGHPAAATTYVLDMGQANPAWQATAPMFRPRSYLNLTVLPDGKVLATGGSTTTDKANFATAVYEAEMWSPATKSWTTMASAQTPRLYHSTALLLPDARVLVAGGGRQACTHPCPVPVTGDQPNAEIFSPPYLFAGPRPVISAAPAVIQPGAAFSVTTPDAARVASVSLVALGSVTHGFNESQRFVPLTFEPAAGGLTVHAPSDGNVAPPGPYMLFLVDTAGVPSLAAMIRLTVAGGDGQAPATPSGVQAPATASSIDLIWSPSSDNVGVTAYQIHRSTAPGLPPTPANAVGQTAATSFSDAPPAGTYYYVVIARDGAGNSSGASNEDSATIAPHVQIVQHVGKDAGSSNGSSTTFPQANAAGDWIAVVVRAGNAPQTMSVTDTRGNVYKKALQLNQTVDPVSLAVYYAENVTAGPNTVSVSVTPGGGSLRFAALEYSGVAASGSLDVTSTAQGSGTAPNSGSATTTAAGDLVIGAVTTANNATVTAGGGYTVQESVPAPPNTKLAVEDLRQASAGAVAATATLSAGQAWGALLAAFKAAGPSLPPPVPDGIFGSPMRASRASADGSSIALSWDVSTCAAPSYKALYGALSSVSSMMVDGAACALGISGSATWSGVPSGNLWFVIVASDGGGTEGSWGTDGVGGNRGGAVASGRCGDAVRTNAGHCP